MGKAPASDLRGRVYGAIAEGGFRRAAARGSSGHAGSCPAGRPSGGGKLSACGDIVAGWVDARGDVTLSERAARLAAGHGIMAHPSSLCRLLKEAGFTVEKTLLASETDRADIARARRVWTRHRQPWMEKRPRRRARRGQRLPPCATMASPRPG